MEERRLQSPSRAKHLVTGSMLVLAGLILLGAGLSIWHVFRLWPLVILGIGLAGVAGACCPPRRRSALMTTAVGAWLLLNETTTVRYRDSWPLLLVAIGALIAWGAMMPAKTCPACEERHHAH
jgi:hypothetical protein